MNYSLMPSFERIALVKIASTLWNKDNIRTLMTEFWFSHRDERKKWQEVEDKVVEKVPHLPLPESLKEKILAFIKPIGLQIQKWMEYHVSADSYRYIDLPKEFCWTSRGTVDKKKTAEVVIKDENLDIANRFILACIYCLENDIPKLWKNMPEKSRDYLCNEYQIARHQKLVVHWIHTMVDVAKKDNLIQRRNTNCSRYQYAFEFEAFVGNKEATEYFLQKLTPKEITESLVSSARYTTESYFAFPEGYHADVLCFLLSQMDKEQQREVFKRHIHEVLQLLLSWPWQSFFIKTVNLAWNFLAKRDYYDLLNRIVCRVKYGFKDCNYQKLFGEFWQQSPYAHKRYVIKKCINGLLISELNQIEDEKNIKLILKDATPNEKSFFLYNGGKGFCEELIEGKKWDLLKFLIRECVSSRTEMIKFKEEFKPFIMRYSEEHLARKKDKYNKFFQLLDDFICRFDKRKSIEEGNRSPAKRQYSLKK